MFRTMKIFAMLTALIGFSGQAFADAPIYTGSFSSTALKGYDAVSYFQGDGVPVKGSKKFQTEWRGAKWRFVSADNLAAFEGDPEKYAPQYGGYCAWAAAHGTLAKGDPKVFTMVEGKLYLNYNESIHAKWSPRKEELIPTADQKYPDLVDLN